MNTLATRLEAVELLTCR